MELNCLKIGARGPQNVAKYRQDGSKMRQSDQDRPKMPQGGSQRTPKWPKKVKSQFQDAEVDPRGSKCPQDGPG